MGTDIFITGSLMGDIFYIIGGTPILIITYIPFYLIFRWVSMRLPVFDTDKREITLKEKYEKLEIKYGLLVERYTKLLKEYNRLKSEK